MITERQLEILQHALAWPKCYRNQYVTGEGSDDYDDCEALVRAGLMRSQQRDWVPGKIYWVTEAGKDELADHDIVPADAQGYRAGGRLLTGEPARAYLKGLRTGIESRLYIEAAAPYPEGEATHDAWTSGVRDGARTTWFRPSEVRHGGPEVDPEDLAVLDYQIERVQARADAAAWAQDPLAELPAHSDQAEALRRIAEALRRIRRAVQPGTHQE